MSRRYTSGEDEAILLNASTASKAGKAFLVRDFKTVVLNLDTAALTDGTIKVFVSYSKTEPDWASAQSSSNRYYPAQIVDQDTGSTINGSTGVAPAGAVHKSYEVAVNGAVWLNVITSGQAAGSYNVRGVGFSGI